MLRFVRSRTGNGPDMESETTITIVVIAALVLAAVVLLAWMRNRRITEQRRTEAVETREEAQRIKVEADRLEAAARERAAAADDLMARADEVDPDVDLSADEPTGVDVDDEVDVRRS